MKILKLLRIPLAVIALGLVVLTAWACSSYGPSPAGAGTAAAKESPSIFNEAPVPEGWPALTPVDEIRVKQYPAYRAAVITADDDNSGSSGMFRPLFNHIKRQDIAMTAPVEMTFSDDGEESSMSFLYRTPDMGTAGADTDDPDVVVKDIPAQTVVSIGLKGRVHPQPVRAGGREAQGLADRRRQLPRRGRAADLRLQQPDGATPDALRRGADPDRADRLSAARGAQHLRLTPFIKPVDADTALRLIPGVAINR